VSRAVLLIDPALGIDSQDLEAAWNGDPDCRALARLEPVPQPPGRFDPTLGAVALTFVVGVATGVTANLVTDALRRLLAEHKPEADLELDYRRDAEGNEQLILRKKGGA